MTQLVRSQVLTGYATLARALGLAPELLAKAAGIDLSALADLDARISAKGFADLLDRSARTAKIEDFGLRLAETRGLGILGPLGLVMREEADLHAALLSLARYLPMHNEALELRLTRERRLAILQLKVHPLGQTDLRHFTELSLGAFFRIIGRFVGPQWKPASVCFEHAAPMDTARHRLFFGCRVEFEHDFNAIVFGASDLDVELSSSDAMLSRYAHRYLESVVKHHDASAGEKVRELIRLWLPSGSCSAAKVARSLGVDRRSVHRYLAEAGESFSSVMNEVRADMAARFLNGPKPLSEVAEMLGFSGPAAFSRWFKQVFGANPSAWRSLPEDQRVVPAARKRARGRLRS
jgi:AraC-like DNA-binding protein